MRVVIRFEADDEALPKQADGLGDAWQLRSVVRIKEARDFLFVDSKALRELHRADTGRAHRDVQRSLRDGFHGRGQKVFSPARFAGLGNYPVFDQIGGEYFVHGIHVGPLMPCPFALR